MQSADMVELSHDALAGRLDDSPLVIAANRGRKGLILGAVERSQLARPQRGRVTLNLVVLHVLKNGS